ncbi:MAG: hypothetical protein AAFP90_20015, partial [Planctomycetota bacterium]
TSSGFVTLNCSTDINQYKRVDYDANGNTVVAGDGVTGVGIVSKPKPHATDDCIAVELHNAPGTRIGIAAEAVADGEPAYPAADGKFGKTVSGNRFGTFKSSGGVDDYVEIIPAA